jgi:hypothetical protein
VAQVNLQKVEAFMARIIFPNRPGRKMEISYSYLFRVLRGKRQAGGKFIDGLIKVGMNPDEIFLSNHYQMATKQ